MMNYKELQEALRGARIEVQQAAIRTHLLLGREEAEQEGDEDKVRGYDSLISEVCV